MRLFGHPVHVMLVHFPVALWPAHTCLHLFASRLPPGVAAVAGFWLLAAATVSGGIAAFFGALDWLEISANERPRFRDASVHALINGSVLFGFIVVTAIEYGQFPAITHGRGILATEIALVVAMFVGNHFGGSVVWRTAAPK